MLGRALAERALVHIDLDTHRLVKTVKVDTVGGKDDVDDFNLEACPSCYWMAICAPTHYCSDNCHCQQD